MDQELRLPRALSLLDLMPASAEPPSGEHTAELAGQETTGQPDRAQEAKLKHRVTLSLKNISHPLPLPKEAELISLTTFDGKLVVLTSKGPYIWQNSDWEQIVPTRTQARAD